MKVVLAVVVLLLLIAIPFAWWSKGATPGAVAEDEPGGTSSAALVAGDAAPTFTLKDTAGAEHALSALKDRKVVLLSFASVTCPICKESAPAHARIFGKFRQNDRFAFWGLYPNAADAAALKAYGKEHRLRYPLLLDVGGTTKAAYHVAMTPTLVLIGKDGKVRAVFSGWNDQTESLVVSAVTDVLAGESVAPTPAELLLGHG